MTDIKILEKALKIIDKKIVGCFKLRTSIPTQKVSDYVSSRLEKILDKKEMEQYLINLAVENQHLKRTKEMIENYEETQKIIENKLEQLESEGAYENTKYKAFRASSGLAGKIAGTYYVDEPIESEE